MEFGKKAIQVISERIGVKPEDFEYSIEQIIEITRVNPNNLEIVKIWKVEQTSPFPFEWWEILIFDSIGGDDGDEYYVLLDLVKWGEGHHPEVAPSEDNITKLNGDTKPIDLTNIEDQIVELIFESDTHIPDDYFSYSNYSEDFFEEVD